MTDQRLNQTEVVCLLVATPFLLFPSLLSVPALLVVLVPWVLRWRVRGAPTVRTPMDAPILCLLLMVPVAVWCSPLPQESLRKLLGIVLGVCFFYGVANGARTRGWMWCWTLLLVGGGAAIALLSLVGTDWATYKTLPLQPLYQRLPRLLHNVTSSGEGGFHPNEVGGTLVLVVPVALAACLALGFDNPGWQTTAVHGRVASPPAGIARPWTSRLWSRPVLLALTALALALTTFAFVLTQSRSAYVGLAVGLLAFGVARSRWFLVALVVIVVVALALGWHVGLEESIEGLVQAQSTRLGVGRFEIWRRAVALIQDFPYTGIGLNAFPYVSEALYPYPHRSAAGLVPHAHNNLLQVGLDLGVPGLAAYVGLLVVFALCAWRVHRLGKSRSLRVLTAGIFAGVLAHQVYGLTDAITLGAKPGFLLWMLLGLMAALYRLELAESDVQARRPEQPSRTLVEAHPSIRRTDAHLRKGETNGPTEEAK